MRPSSASDMHRRDLRERAAIQIMAAIVGSMQTGMNDAGIKGLKVGTFPGAAEQAAVAILAADALVEALEKESK